MVPVDAFLFSHSGQRTFKILSCARTRLSHCTRTTEQFLTSRVSLAAEDARQAQSRRMIGRPHNAPRGPLVSCRFWKEHPQQELLLPHARTRHATGRVWLTRVGCCHPLPSAPAAALEAAKCIQTKQQVKFWIVARYIQPDTLDLHVYVYAQLVFIPLSKHSSEGSFDNNWCPPRWPLLRPRVDLCLVQL